MKRTISLISIFFLIIAITGCGNEKKLTCTQTITTENYGTQAITSVTSFKNDTISKQTITTEITLSDAMAIYKDEFFTSMQESTNDMLNKNGIEVSYTENENVITENITITIADLDDNSKDLSNINSEESYDELKADFENNGYTCK
ncbi:MAG: hypothetical protein PHD02_01910 [Bacilli bacterium]|nr:hypothetical protein [Bacilli bacterium]